MRTLLCSVFAVAALAGCAAVQEPYDYGYSPSYGYSPYYGDAYYYDTAPGYFAFDYNRYDYSPGYRGGVVVNRPAVQGSVQQRFGRTSSRDRTGRLALTSNASAVTSRRPDRSITARN